MLVTPDTMREKRRLEAIHHEEWNEGVVRRNRRDAAGTDGSSGFIDSTGDARTVVQRGRPWFWCSCSEAIPEYSVFTIVGGTTVNGVPQLEAVKAVPESGGDVFKRAGFMPLLTNGQFA